MAVSQLKVNGCAVGSLLHYPLSSLTHWRKMHEICPLCSYQVHCLSWLPLVKHADTGMFALFRMINESNKLQISSFLPSALFKRKFPTCGPGSREAGSCVEQQPFPFLCLTAQPCWEACRARQEGCPCFSPLFKWIFIHPVALARECRFFSKLPYPPYSVLLNYPVNGLIAFKFGR